MGGYKRQNLVTRKETYSRDAGLKEIIGASKVRDVKREKEQEKIEFELNNEGHDSDESTESVEEVEQ